MTGYTCPVTSVLIDLVSRPRYPASVTDRSPSATALQKAPGPFKKGVAQHG